MTFGSALVSAPCPRSVPAVTSTSSSRNASYRPDIESSTCAPVPAATPIELERRGIRASGFGLTPDYVALANARADAAGVAPQIVVGDVRSADSGPASMRQF